MAGILVGLFLSSSNNGVRAVVPLSAGLLLGASLFGLLPELAHDLSWAGSLAVFAAGFLVLTAVDRFGIPICPDCSPDHGHHRCAAPLHGFAIPLLAAAGAHSLFDGWAIAASGSSGAPNVSIALPLALVLHKLPEGVSFAVILNQSVGSRRRAGGLALLAQLLTLAGGAVAIAWSRRLGSAWTGYPLALAGGFFLFLAWHALRAEWKRSPRWALLSGLGGLLFSAGLQSGVRAFLSR